MEEIRWTPGIGDPTFVGWLTVFAYFFCAHLCLKAFMKEKTGPPRPYFDAIRALMRVVFRHFPQVPNPARRASIWLALGILMAALGINKQLDLQSLFTDIGRVFAHQQNWYEHRREVQLLFILIILALGAASMLTFWILTRGQLKDFRLTLLGLSFLVCFVILRASSFHSMDQFISFRIGGLRMNWILELSGISLISWGAHLRLRR